MSSLIIGGTSGLGLELAKRLQLKGQVIITGRHDPQIEGLIYKEFNLTSHDNLAVAIEQFIGSLPKIDNFIYAAGYYQEGTLTELTDEEIKHMLDVGIHAPIWFVRELLQYHGMLDSFIAITSTSQWTPRLKEPIYTAVKAALGQFANSVSQDKHIGKTLVAGPAGMTTDFWRMSKHDKAGFNSPEWVAEQIIEQMFDEFRYKFIKILRDPPAVHIEEIR